MPRAPTKTSPQATVVERTMPDSGNSIRLLLEPRPGRQVKIIEYRRRRQDEARYKRLRDEEGGVVAFELLRLEESYEALFPQGGLFDSIQAPAPTRPRRRRRR